MASAQTITTWIRPSQAVAARSYCELNHAVGLTSAAWRRLNSTDNLPRDVRAQECTVVICFKASLVINIWLGGTQGMTFSARSHAAKCKARSRPAHMFWAVLAGTIDLVCAVLRGEAYHCETAWQNYCARSAHPYPNAKRPA